MKSNLIDRKIYMNNNSIPYEKQIFVCTNTKDGGTACSNEGKGETIFRELRNIAKERKIHPRIRVAQAKCLGQCAQGVNIMVYPDNVWHNDVTTEDVPNLVKMYFEKAAK